MFYAANLIHLPNAQRYDMYFGALIGLFLLLLSRKHHSVGWVFITGLTLTHLELTRPFMLYLLVPLAVACFWLHSEVLGSTVKLAAFSVPIFFFSGLWHVHVYTEHTQILWTNHLGCNLYRSVRVPTESRFSTITVELEPERPARRDGLASNLNTDVHSRNSQLLSQEIFTRFRENPLAFIDLVAARSNLISSQSTQTFGRVPNHFTTVFYSRCVRLAYFCLIINSALWLISIGRRGFPNLLDRMVEVVATFLTSALYILVAVGEYGEVGRFVMPIAPLLLWQIIFLVRRLIGTCRRRFGGNRMGQRGAIEPRLPESQEQNRQFTPKTARSSTCPVHGDSVPQIGFWGQCSV